MELPIQTEDEMKLIENLLINESNIKNLVSHPFQATFQSKMTNFFFIIYFLQKSIILEKFGSTPSVNEMVKFCFTDQLMSQYNVTGTLQKKRLETLRFINNVLYGVYGFD
jgi:hypothetical protein